MKMRICLVVLGVMLLAAGAPTSRAQTAAAAKPRQLKQAAYIKSPNPAMGDHFGDGGTFGCSERGWKYSGRRCAS
jgi:hypothetical protein